MQRKIPCSPDRVRTDEVTSCTGKVLKEFEKELQKKKGIGGRRDLNSKFKVEPREEREYTFIYILKDERLSDNDSIENLIKEL